MPPKKKQAEPAQPPPTRRRTRGMGVSPSGHKSLETVAVAPKPVPKYKNNKRKAPEPEDEEAEGVEPAVKRPRYSAPFKLPTGRERCGLDDISDEHDVSDEHDIDNIAPPPNTPSQSREAPSNTPSQSREASSKTPSQSREAPSKTPSPATEEMRTRREASKLVKSIVKSRDERARSERAKLHNGGDNREDEEIDIDNIAPPMTPGQAREETRRNRIILQEEKLRKERAQLRKERADWLNDKATAEWEMSDSFSEKAQKKNQGASSSSASSKKAPYKLVKVSTVSVSADIPARLLSRHETEMILTDATLVKTTHILANYHKENPENFPTPREMEQLLSEFKAKKSARTDSSTSPSPSNDHTTRTSPEASTSQRSQQQPIHPELEGRIDRPVGSEHTPVLEPEVQNVAMLNVQVAEEAATQDQAGEVQPAVEVPQTPTPQQPNAQQSRRWFSSVSSFLSTPVKFFGRRRQSAEAAATNGEAVVGEPSNDHLIPQTADFAIQPITPINRRNGRQLISQSERRPSQQSSTTAPITPTNRPTGRNLFPQTERRRGILVQGPKTGSKTERHVRFLSPDGRPPLHMRNILSEEQKQEIWRKQDEDIHSKQRQDRRAKTHAQVEDEDEHETTQHAESARAGKKRKHYHPDVPEGAWNYEGTFSVPDSPTSSEEGDESSSQDNLDRRSASVRKNRYEGTLFAQPPDVQANIDEGRHPLTNRSVMTSWVQTDNIFNKYLGRENKSHDDDATLNQKPAGSADGGSGSGSGSGSSSSRKVKTFGGRVCGDFDALLSRGPDFYAKYPDFGKAKHGGSGTTFKAPEYENENRNEESVTEIEGNTVENAAGDGSILQPKAWTQTPPPKPKPSNAQLPSTPADLAKARHEKYKPARPSGLRNVSVMSPLAQPEASTEAPTDTRLPWNIPLEELGIFPPHILAAINAIPDHLIPAMPLPARFYEQQVQVPPEVENAVLNILH